MKSNLLSCFGRIGKFKELENWLRLFLWTGCGFMFFFSCGGGNVNEPIIQESALEFIREGWVKYELNDLDGAKDSFNKAVKLDPNLWESYSGLGWTEFGLLNLPGAGRDFVVANALDSLKIDPIVGHVFVSFERNRYTEALSWANKAFAADSAQFLSEDAQYKFIHNGKVHGRQIHKMVALSHYYLGNFTKSYDHIRLYLSPGLDFDINSPGFPQRILEELKKL